MLLKCQINSVQLFLFPGTRSERKFWWESEIRKKKNIASNLSKIVTTECLRFWWRYNKKGDSTLQGASLVTETVKWLNQATSRQAVSGGVARWQPATPLQGITARHLLYRMDLHWLSCISDNIQHNTTYTRVSSRHNLAAITTALTDRQRRTNNPPAWTKGRLHQRYLNRHLI